MKLLLALAVAGVPLAGCFAGSDEEGSTALVPPTVDCEPPPAQGRSPPGIAVSPQPTTNLRWAWSHEPAVVGQPVLLRIALCFAPDISAHPFHYRLGESSLVRYEQESDQEWRGTAKPGDTAFHDVVFHPVTWGNDAIPFEPVSGSVGGSFGFLVATSESRILEHYGVVGGAPDDNPPLAVDDPTSVGFTVWPKASAVGRSMEATVDIPAAFVIQQPPQNRTAPGDHENASRPRTHAWDPEPQRGNRGGTYTTWINGTSHRSLIFGVSPQEAGGFEILFTFRLGDDVLRTRQFVTVARPS